MNDRDEMEVSVGLFLSPDENEDLQAAFDRGTSMEVVIQREGGREEIATGRVVSLSEGVSYTESGTEGDRDE
ncbi:hypothetical protein ACLI4Z_19260 (plasmid) [Natrialbaceae archaeon A-arb3/5]